MRDFQRFTDRARLQSLQQRQAQQARQALVPRGRPPRKPPVNVPPAGGQNREGGPDA